MMSHEIINIARLAMKDRDWHLALQKWQQAIDLYPEEIAAYNGMGNTLARLGDVERAESIFQAITHKWPDKSIGFNSLGNLAMETQQWELAKTRWQLAIDLFPKNLQAYEGLSQSLIQLKEFQLAEIVLTTIVRQCPKKSDGFMALAELAFQQKQWEIAAQRWRRVINKFPEEITAYINLGTSLVKLKQFDRAQSIFKKITNKWPDKASGFNALANLAMQNQQWELAKKKWQIAMKMFPKNLKAHEGLGKALIELEQFRQAEQIFQKIAQIWTDRSTGFNGLVNIAIRTEQWILANQRCEDLIAKFPDFIDGYIKLGNIQTKLGQFERAESIFVELIQKFPDNVIGFNALAELAMHGQQWELAKSRWEIAIERFSNSLPNLPGYIGKIKAEIELQEWESAETTLQQIIDREDNLEAIFTIIIKLAFHTNCWKLVLEKFDLLIERNIYLILNLDRQNTIYVKIANLINHLVESNQIILAELVINKLEAKITDNFNSLNSIAIWKSAIAQAKAEYDLADSLCLELIDRQTNNAINLNFQRIKNYWQQHNFQKTLQLSEEFIITKQTKHSQLKIIYQALRIKSEALIKLEKIEAAKNQLEQLIKLLPTQHQAYLLLIEIFYFHDCNYQKALDLTKLAIDNGVRQRQLIFYRSLALSSLGKTKEALTTIERYLANMPTDKLATIYRSQILRDRHQYRDALAQLNQILIAGGYTPLKSTPEQYELTISHLQCQSETQIETTKMVSIIMTVYQRNQWLEIAIDSILQQTYRHLELIIVDDASTDDTWEWLQQIAITDNRIRLLKMTTNVGTYVAKNQGMLFSQGDYIAFMDADDWIHPQKLEAQIKILENSDAIAVTSSYLRVQTNSDLEFMPEKPMRQGCITLCFKKQPVLKQVGFFDAVRSMADSEYESRIKIVFGLHSIKQIEEPLLISMRHENSITGGGWQLTKITWHGNQLSQFPYIAAYKAWHGYLKSNRDRAYLPHPLDFRRFATPEHLLSFASR